MLTALQQEYMDVRSQELEREIHKMKRERAAREEIDLARASVAIIEEQLAQFRVIELSAGEAERHSATANLERENFKRDELAELLGRVERETPEPDASCWIEMQQAFVTKYVPFSVGAITLATSETEVLEQARSKTPERQHHLIDSIEEDGRKRYSCEIIDPFGEIVFSLIYNRLERRWQISDFHSCPWHRCTKPEEYGTKEECLSCMKLRMFLIQFVDAALAEHPVQRQEENKPAAKPARKSAREAIELLEIYRKRRNHDAEEQIERIMRLTGHTNTTIQDLNVLYNALLDSVRYIYLDEDGSNKILECMKSIARNELSVPLGIYQDPGGTTDGRAIWFTVERPIALPDVDFVIKSLLFANLGNEYMQTEASRKIGRNSNILEIQARHNVWGVDVLNEQSLVRFSCVFQEGRWRLNASHQCPFDACRKVTSNGVTTLQECARCKLVYKWIGMWIGTVLLARTGYFQEVVMQERDERREAASKSTASRQKSSTQQTSQKIYTLTVDITKRVISIPADIPEEGEDQAERERRANWLAMHAPEEIEIVKKSAKEHNRHYRDGRVVRVSRSKERAYRKLKNTTVIEELK